MWIYIQLHMDLYKTIDGYIYIIIYGYIYMEIYIYIHTHASIHLCIDNIYIIHFDAAKEFR